MTDPLATEDRFAPRSGTVPAKPPTFVRDRQAEGHRPLRADVAEPFPPRAFFRRLHSAHLLIRTLGERHQNVEPTAVDVTEHLHRATLAAAVVRNARRLDLAFVVEARSQGVGWQDIASAMGKDEPGPVIAGAVLAVARGEHRLTVPTYPRLLEQDSGNVGKAAEVLQLIAERIALDEGLFLSPRTVSTQWTQDEAASPHPFSPVSMPRPLDRTWARKLLLLIGEDPQEPAVSPSTAVTPSRFLSDRGRAASLNGITELHAISRPQEETYRQIRRNVEVGAEELLAGLAIGSAVEEMAEDHLAQEVHSAVAAGATWREVGLANGCSAAAAQKLYSAETTTEVGLQ